MIQFILLYLALGVLLSIIINISLWFVHKPVLPASEIITCILVWPSITITFCKLVINQVYINDIVDEE